MFRRECWIRRPALTRLEGHLRWAKGRCVGAELCMRVLRLKRLLIRIVFVGGERGWLWGGVEIVLCVRRAPGRLFGTPWCMERSIEGYVVCFVHQLIWEVGGGCQRKQSLTEILDEADVGNASLKALWGRLPRITPIVWKIH